MGDWTLFFFFWAILEVKPGTIDCPLTVNKKMASLVEEFIEAPSEEELDRCTKEKLLKLAEYFNVEVTDKRLKEK